MRESPPIKWTFSFGYFDQGLQHAAREYSELLEKGIAISNSPAGIEEKLTLGQQNGYAERLMRMIKEEVELAEHRNFEEAYRGIGQFLEDMYSKKRIHH